MTQKAMTRAGGNQPVVYVVRFWAAADAIDELMRWLDGGHMAEVASQPGFRSVKMLDVGEKDAQGWHAFANLYEVDSRADFEAYQRNAALQEKFAHQRETFAARMRFERFSGTVVRQLPSAA